MREQRGVVLENEASDVERVIPAALIYVIAANVRVLIDDKDALRTLPLDNRGGHKAADASAQYNDVEISFHLCLPLATRSAFPAAGGMIAGPDKLASKLGQG